MSMLIDMNMSPDWVEAFEAAGFSAVHWSSVGSPSASDADIMSYAVRHGHWVVTHDLDFGAILAATDAKTPSVVQIRGAGLLPEAIRDQVLRGVAQVISDLEQGALVTIDAQRVRVRVLPLSAVGRAC